VHAVVTGFVVFTGTDTGVGKTFVTSRVARSLARSGTRVVAIKPVETGCDETTLASEDGHLLAEATGQASPLRALVRFREPLTPALAAEEEGRTLDVGDLVERVRAAAGDASVALVEGAGGLMSPISWTEDLSHLARGLGASALVVGADKLGTLNHVRLTLAALAAAGVPPIGIVLSAAMPDGSTGTNASVLARVVGGELARRIEVVGRDAPDDDAVFGRVARWIAER
jgi:dethiobiotin synthetase